MNMFSTSERFAERSLSTREIQNRRAVRLWLYAVAFLVFALVVVGGGTRLAEAGLSITEWKPIHGMIPPLSAREWQEQFDLYRQIPQYQLINRGMSLEEFKVIFWWEWAHRFLARTLGFAFAVPLAFFWLTGRLESRLKPRLVGLLALGGLQGAIGWWMVASGLVERTDVSQYRLAVHLTLACIIFASILWVARGLVTHPREAPPTAHSAKVGGLIVLLTLVQIYLGGLVAGLNAGLTFNTWPLMDGQWIPANLFPMEPLWRNFFENVMTVQFTHRIGAYVLTAVVILHAVAAYRIAPRSRHAKGAALVAGLVLVQATIGVATLLHMAAIHWALVHQAFAVVVMAGVVIHARGLVGSYRAPATA